MPQATPLLLGGVKEMHGNKQQTEKKEKAPYIKNGQLMVCTADTTAGTILLRLCL